MGDVVVEGEVRHLAVQDWTGFQPELADIFVDTAEQACSLIFPVASGQVPANTLIDLLKGMGVLRAVATPATWHAIVHHTSMLAPVIHRFAATVIH